MVLLCRSLTAVKPSKDSSKLYDHQQKKNIKFSIYSKSNAVSAHTNKTFSKKEAPNIFQAWMLGSLQRDFTLQTYPLHHRHGWVVVTAWLVGLKIKWRSAPEFAKTAFEFISISFNLVENKKAQLGKCGGNHKPLPCMLLSAPSQ